jgi:nitrogen fixation/metabolism regulation signal transduction histidine kinase
LRAKIVLYLVSVHLVVAALAVYFLRQQRLWLLAVEALLVISVAFGIHVFRSIFVPLQLIRAGTQLLRDAEFTTRLREVNQAEMDELVGVYNRMIDRLREERVRLLEQYHFISQIIQTSPQGILIFDFDDRISLSNPSVVRMLQTPAENLAGKKLRELEGQFVGELSTLSTGESRVVPLDGARRVLCRMASFQDRGFPRKFLMMEELTEELRRAERSAYEKIIRMMSHEINNSIGASNSLLQSCLNYRDQLREADRHDFETALQVAMSRNHHLNSFMKSYADVIRLPKPEIRPCDVKQLLEDLAVLLRAECREKRIEWRWDTAEPSDPAPMDKNQMEQVFVNVLRNAIEAIGEEGVITVRLGRKVVEIEDTGRGISPDIKANLFTPFFSTKENGRGIGLTMVREILTQHGFGFSLGSQPGGPTRFTVSFGSFGDRLRNPETRPAAPPG